MENKSYEEITQEFLSKRNLEKEELKRKIQDLLDKYYPKEYFVEYSDKKWSEYPVELQEWVVRKPYTLMSYMVNVFKNFDDETFSILKDRGITERNFDILKILLLKVAEHRMCEEATEEWDKVFDPILDDVGLENIQIDECLGKYYPAYYLDDEYKNYENCPVELRQFVYESIYELRETLIEKYRDVYLKWYEVLIDRGMKGDELALLRIMLMKIAIIEMEKLFYEQQCDPNY